MNKLCSVKIVTSLTNKVPIVLMLFLMTEIINIDEEYRLGISPRSQHPCGQIAF